MGAVQYVVFPSHTEESEYEIVPFAAHSHMLACFFEVGEIGMSQDRCIFLINHRSWGDFFIHRAVCDHLRSRKWSRFHSLWQVTDTQAAHLARNLVAIAFPLLWVFCKVDGALWFFNNHNIGRSLKSLFFSVTLTTVTYRINRTISRMARRAMEDYQNAFSDRVSGGHQELEQYSIQA